jgi:hypothetical protein
MRAKTLCGIGLTGLIGIAAVMASPACSVTFSLPAGGVAVTAFGSCDTTDGYAVLTNTAFCGSGFAGCGSGETYALCDGTAYTACDCNGPWLSSGTYTEISGPDFGAGSDGGPGADGGSDGPSSTDGSTGDGPSQGGDSSDTVDSGGTGDSGGGGG